MKALFSTEKSKCLWERYSHPQYDNKQAHQGYWEREAQRAALPGTKHGHLQPCLRPPSRDNWMEVCPRLTLTHELRVVDDVSLSYYQSWVPQEQWFLTQLHITITITCQSFKNGDTWTVPDICGIRPHVGVWLRHVYFYKALWIFRCSSRVENCNLGANVSSWWLAGGPWWGGTSGWGPEHWVPGTRVRGKGGSINTK